MFDDDGEPFNPFAIGPPGTGTRYAYEMPSAPTYPEPVYATWPPPKEHLNKSISQGTLAEQRSTTGPDSCKRQKSQMGEVGISKAINEEMAASKHLATDKRRIHAGGQSKTTMLGTSSSKIMTTLMPVRSRRSHSKSSVMSRASNASTEASMRVSYSPRLDTKSNATLTSKRSLNKDANDDKISRISLRNNAGEHHESRGSLRSRDDRASRVSVRSKASDYQADNVSRVSQRSRKSEHHADNVSHFSRRSRESQRQADNISMASKTSKVSQADNISRMSNRSRASRADDNLSRISVKSQAGDNIPLQLKSSAPTKANIISNMKPSPKELAESLREELNQSMATTKSLSAKAAELSERLRAGNDTKHHRFHSLVRAEFLNTEPLKRCRQDRMSFWCKDALLS